ncbi:MAG TPA: YfcE family phosphodiesterase [Spirochaetota bacterium]|nr:YfcE family phosphodiesterase [Spirochaetota bacterium]
MAKFLVLSDSHGETELIRSVVSSELPFDELIFCGDGIDDLTRADLPKKFIVTAVRGNVDRVRGCAGDDVAFTEAEGVRIMVTHGDMFDVKRTMMFVRREAEAKNAGLVIVGHTHIPYLNEASGPAVLNPGSLKAGSYATVTVTDAGMKFDMKEIC